MTINFLAQLWSGLFGTKGKGPVILLGLGMGWRLNLLHLWKNVIADDVISISVLAAFALSLTSSGLVVVGCGTRVDTIIGGGLGGRGVRGKQKAEEEEYQVHNETILFVNQN